MSARLAVGDLIQVTHACPWRRFRPGDTGRVVAVNDYGSASIVYYCEMDEANAGTPWVVFLPGQIEHLGASEAVAEEMLHLDLHAENVRAARKTLLEIAEILAWADAHRARTGEWPRIHSGPIHEASRETWQGIDRALRYGHRGLPGGDSLPRLLGRERGASPQPRGRRPKAIAEPAYLGLRLSC